MFTKPQHLRRGDTIGLVSPSSGMAGTVPHRVERAKHMLGEMGFDVHIGTHALKTRGYVSSTVEDRVRDLHAMFEDSAVKAIVCFIGGNHSNQLLPSLDFDVIARHPKIFVGYSDITVLHFAFLTQAHLISFYGPAALTQFAEFPSMLAYTKRYFEKAVMETEPIGAIAPSEEWTDEVLDWTKKEDTARGRIFKNNAKFEWLKHGAAEGPLIGGCITSMMHVRGTKYWPDLHNALLFWEIPESEFDFRRGESLRTIDSFLADLDNCGALRDIAGMIIGRPFGYEEDEVTDLKNVIVERTKRYDFPILFNADFGHTDPMITIPLGVHARIDSSENRFAIMEAGVS